MSLLCRFILKSSLLSLLSFSSFAVTLVGVIEGGELRWTNAREVGSYIVLSNWKPVGGLTPTSEWAPGTFLSTPNSDVTLSGPKEDVAIEFGVVGVEYGLGQAADKFVERGDTPFGARECDVLQMQNSRAMLVGTNCTTSETYSTGSSNVQYTPFQFVRPIIQADSDAIMRAFEGIEPVAGLYTGAIFLQPTYYFTSASGTWTNRYAASVPVNVQIRFVPANLENVDIVGNGVIKPSYDTVNYEVSGETTFDITATGVFTEGIKLTLDDTDYDLEFETEGVASIPYSISCSGGCEHTELVLEGVLNQPDTIVTGTDTEVSFQLKVHYDDLKAGEVETGHYNDQFVIYLEEAL